MSMSIVGAIHETKKAKDLFEDFGRATKGGMGEKLAKKCVDKLDWIYTQIVTIPAFSDAVRNDIRKEWSSDSWTLDALHEKILKLNPASRAFVEEVVDSIINGYEVKVNGNDVEFDKNP